MQDFLRIPESWGDPVPGLTRVFLLIFVVLVIESTAVFLKGYLPRLPSIVLSMLTRSIDVMILWALGPWSLKKVLTPKAIKDALTITLILAVLGILFLATWKKFTGSPFLNPGEAFLRKPPPLVFSFFITVCLISPIAEELLFRGLFFRKMREKWSFWVCTLTVSAVFALLHLIFGGRVTAALMPFLGSLIFCSGYEKTKGILAPVFLHISGNCIIYLSPIIGFI